MKIYFRKILFALLAISTIQAFTYDVPENYIINPLETSHGIIVTNEYESAIYLIKDNKLEVLVEAPGCGRYLSVSPDGNKIGFKLINELSGLQTPAYYDLTSNKIVELNKPVEKCGQVDFDAEGNIYYTVGKKLVRRANNGIEEFNIGTYSNLTPVSPDGHYVIVNEDDQLFLYNLQNKTLVKLTNDDNGYYNSSWSPDGEYIAFQSINANVFTIKIESGKLFRAGPGENPRWSSDSKNIIYFKKDINFEEHKLLGSDLYVYNVLDKSSGQLTSTPGIYEMNPSFTKSGRAIFDTYSGRQIKSLDMSDAGESRSVYKLTELPNRDKISSARKNRNIETTQDLDDWMHIHQVFDTRDSGPWTNNPQNGRHQGYLCCGATTAMEAIASYGILPPKPIHTHGHTSDYGIYISDEYEYEGHVYAGFTTTGDRPGFMTGAHGYMWNSGGSPSSNAAQFMRNHGIDAHRHSNPSWGMVKAEIDAGYPYMLCTISLTDGHIVLGIGQYGDNQTLYCNDPYGDKNAGSYGAIRNGKNAVYDWGDENTGHIKITPVVWGVTARYDKTLPLISCYPADGQENVSPSSLVMLDFNNPLNRESLEDLVFVYDELINKVETEYDFSLISEGKLIIKPVNGFEENTTYNIYIDYRTSSSNGLQYAKNALIEFTTGENRALSGEVIEDFESGNQFGLATYGVIDSVTSADLSGDKYYQANSSLEINYEFDNPNGSGYARVLYDPEPVVGQAADKYIGLWVFGDCSNNSFEVWFSKEDGSIACPVKVALNWSGWKFINADLSEMFDDNNITLNSIAVRQNKAMGIAGKVYIDYLAVQEMLPGVIEFNLAGMNSVALEEELMLVFNKPMDKTSTENAIDIYPGTEGSFNWSADDVISFTPAESLLPNTEYVVAVGIDASDSYGNSIKEGYRFNFRTERTGLLLEDSYPSDGMTEVSTDVKVILDFDEYIDRNTLYGNILFTDAENNPVDIAVDAGGYTMGKVMFEPADPLDENSTYKIQVKTGVKDTAGLNVPSDFEISFTTLDEKYESGNILESFETVDNWIQPAESGYSIGVHNYVSKLARYSARKVSGEYSAKLEYKFTGVRGVCNIELAETLPVGLSGGAGLWINGDYSYNDFRFHLINSSEEIIKTDPVKLDWTGWKLVQVNLSEYAAQDITGLHSIAIVQTDSGSISSEILFDDLQTDIVLPVREESALPDEFILSQNYPNPFNPSTTIEYTIPVVDANFASTTSHVKLVVYDILGREVATLVNTKQKPGRYRVEFNGSKLATGVYFYKLDAGEFRSVKKMLLVK